MDNNKKDPNVDKNINNDFSAKDQKPMNPLLAGALGVAAGAAAYALTKKENQDKIKKAAAGMKKNFDQKARDVKGGLAQKANEVGDRLKQAADKAKQGIDEAQNKINEDKLPPEELII